VNTSANVLDAVTVKIAAPRVKQAWVVGKVATVSGDNISVALRNGLTLSVVVSSTTTYTMNGAAATLADVTVGVFVRAAGSVNTTANALDATSVSIGGGSGHDTSMSSGISAHLFGHGAGAPGSGLGFADHHRGFGGRRR
jgi:hypothetical protein